MTTPENGNDSKVTKLSESLAVPVQQLRRTCDLSDLPFETTEQVEPLQGTFGQDRGVSALEFGVEIADGGFNIFITGATGSGRRTTARGYLDQVARTQPVPDDWVYVHNFSDPYRPRAIRLAPGEGNKLAGRMDELIAAARREIPRAFESENYEHRKGHLLSRLQQRQQAVYAHVQEAAQAKGFTIEITPSGIVTLPVANGQPLSQEQYEQLPKEAREEIERKGKEVKEHMEQALHQGRKLEKETAEKLRQLEREVALFAVGHLFEDIQNYYQDNPKLMEYLKEVQEDIPDHLDDFRGAVKQEGQPAAPPEAPVAPKDERLTRYRVNVLIDNSSTQGAPVVEVYNPIYYNVMGRIEYEARFGAMTTDFRQIKAGAVHRANGGYLLLEAKDVLTSPMVWESLKKALKTREARIENMGEQISPVPATTLRPEPIPLQVKVVLIGNPAIYYLLYGQDDDFRNMFKVKADFGPDMSRTAQNVLGYAGFISRQAREKGLRHFDKGAVARIVEQSSRLVEDQSKLTTRFSDIADLLVESSFWAGKNSHQVVMADDVDKAIGHKEFRSSLVEERFQQMIDDGTIMIDVQGAAEGQVNGLSVAMFGDYSFGTPSRITARTSLGSGGVVNVEREIKLSGPIHSKGVLILSGYLSGRYAQDYPLALSATLTFEQMYSEVDGDSASSAELYALLSSLSGLPIKQGIAVTGSVNQYGHVQAVGGVTQKVEGFFEACKAKGLTGEQGVILPETNVRTLMLKDEVVQAVRDGKFRVWSVRSVDQGIELLTGIPAGEKTADGVYPAGTVHQLVDSRLRQYAQRLREYGPGTAVRATLGE
jgi:predicted ATP-dependent protease